MSKSLRLGVLLFVACACSRNLTGSSRPADAEAAPAAETHATQTFTGMCDASAAVPLSDRLFLVADDEDNVLRVYDADRAGAPLAAVDLSTALRLSRSKKAKRSPETDIEAGTRLGDVALWLTSHGRNKKGKAKLERLRLFATTAPSSGEAPALLGKPYDGLLADLVAHEKLARFELAEAALRAPKDPGGLNLEGMTARREGGVWIGFRNPVPDGRALLVPLLNPLEVVRGEPARFGAPVTLDLGGLGVRSLSFWRGRYLIAAGPIDSEGSSRLYMWNGGPSARAVSELRLEDFNPEAFFTPEGRDRIMLLSDDGSTPIDGIECKRLPDARHKRFRGLWVALPALEDARHAP